MEKITKATHRMVGSGARRFLAVGRVLMCRGRQLIAAPQRARHAAAHSLMATPMTRLRSLSATFQPLPLRHLCTKPMTAESIAEELSELYGEARELMEDAEDSLGKVYFVDDLNEAREAIEQMIKRFEDARTQLPPAEAEQLVQIVGLKMEELRSRLATMDENLIHGDD